jgi:hypothetical protein
MTITRNLTTESAISEFCEQLKQDMLRDLGTGATLLTNTKIHYMDILDANGQLHDRVTAGWRIAIASQTRL